MNTSTKPSRVIRDEHGVTYVHADLVGGYKIVYWYNASVKSWVVQTLDRDDCQQGGSDYVYAKDQAVAAACFRLRNATYHI